ncbi:amino acid transporter [Aeromicrobium panaciterrae]|uniref:Amino acid transporter n=1 Tax=Aeromicrobium panaciterrae TaxID=363861 RepID=A0ABU1UJ97_9ACTN|nr:APC family permease [Aeromicrobium panaciterrae]MDR7085264.1 amino acid transporter [Aeromicrobium panaciterrae]
MDKPKAPIATESTYAAEQKQHLVKTLSGFDMVFFTVAVIVGLDLIGQAASYGAEAFTWTLVLVFLFLLPYGLVMAEVGSAFTAEGGPYEWVKMTMGRFWAGLNTIFYWITNPFWVGGSLAFVGTEAWSSGISNISSGGFWDYAFKFLFIWLTISSAIISFKIGKWIPTLGAMLKIGLVVIFAITVIAYGIKNGVEGFKLGDLKPSSAGLLAIAPLILFSFVGFEGQNGAAEEMKDPKKDVPSSIFKSGLLAAFCYLTPIFLVLLVLPSEAITGLGGFLDAVKESYSIYGGAQDALYGITCFLFILTLANSGAAWMMCGDRVLAVAAADGAFFPYFGAFHPTLGTPLRANLLSGVAATAFSFAAIKLLNSGSAATFEVVLLIAISTTLISYILMFPAVYLLRRSHPDVPRPYRLGASGDGLMLGSVILITFWVVLGSWTAVFPGTLDRLLGLDYDFVDNWGMSMAKFETFTLGTLAVVVTVAVLGYVSGTKVRSDLVEVPLAPPDAAEEVPAS